MKPTKQFRWWAIFNLYSMIFLCVITPLLSTLIASLLTETPHKLMTLPVTFSNFMQLKQMIYWMLGGRSTYDQMLFIMIGLFVACMYIIFDTQLIIERAEQGDKDVPTHTLMLFMDLFDLFIRIVQLLLKLQEDKDRKKKRDD